MDYGISDAFPGIATSTAYDTTKNSSSVSMDDFLKILSASMQNPSMSSDSSSGGSSSTDYVSQLAQFTTLDQLNNMGKELTTSVMALQQQQAYSLFGKQVTLNNNGQSVTGKVDKVRFANGFATLVVNGSEYKMSALAEVG
ncbi:flagellar hook capping FlgD N-terminal domain-containing protein [Liquorilactobacillus satsumensis]|uniref:flagellar hook capping FlgD N-terminal domain-containing protein n=1 Tax=Liquorilactobacillus satsumensis TaxID=259059 RepID=UPI001E5012C6|nr:flagellar hook capping FlgD N-terminal domain-containing protein [Liquorilactobacillus satsumensis]MCC7666596.1 flagellar basal body rod modification protein [Liquorilactobacillus satsumensis]MCP9357843.1 flagellar basal body rod modification protein [Liquorilactobacillus satsumensis]MCP9371583.1 flagellar basal body rod modification protein [Liquorilactobacillus satsumensis]